MQLGILIPTSDAVNGDVASSVRAVLMQQSLRALSMTYDRLSRMVAADQVALVVTRRGELEKIEDDWSYVVGVGTIDFTKSLMDGSTAHIKDFAFDDSVRDFGTRKALAQALIAKAVAADADRIQLEIDVNRSVGAVFAQLGFAPRKDNALWVRALQRGK